MRSPVQISKRHQLLLGYIVKYRRLRGMASKKLIIEQLIVAYAKQLATGMPEPQWRANLVTLINEAEKEAD